MNGHLKDLVRDKITGIEGIVIGETKWLYGCRRLVIQPRTLKPDGSTHDSVSFDEDQVDVITENAVDVKTKETGGPMPEPKRH